MVLKKYEIRVPKVNCLKIMNFDGQIINQKLMPKIESVTLLNAYKMMNLSRNYEMLAFQYQRQGRMLTFPPSMGQEAVQVAIGMNFDHKHDWYVSGYRNHATLLYLKKPLKEIFQYWCGNERGNKSALGLNITPIDVLIGTQFSHAVGVALANKLQKKSSIVFTDIGDGGTSSGEFYSALNWAGVQKLPVIFIIQNNQWAISTPTKLQTASASLAQKAIGANVLSFQVDGNDLFASYVVLQEARKYVQENQKPVLIEALTYRIGPHTTADDPTLYRTSEYHQEQLKNDPLIRLKKYLINCQLWNEDQQIELDEVQKQAVKASFHEALNDLEMPLQDIFAYTYAELTPDLIEQKNELLNFFTPNKEVVHETHKNLK